MNDLFKPSLALNQRFAEFSDREVLIDMKRDDLLHPTVSGNKLRKLKYNVKYVLENHFGQILTYGGAYSNHIAATAAAGKIMGLKTIGVIRGEELGVDLEKTLAQNETLKMAHENGMHLHFVKREAYSNKMDPSVQKELYNEYGVYYNIPEGGTNELAIRGTEEILTARDKTYYDIIAVAAGTGGTAAGIINTASQNQEVMVFGALKGEFLKRDIKKYTGVQNFQFYDDQTFGGYAKSDDRLIHFLNVSFCNSAKLGMNSGGIPLEPIYTGKMMYRLQEMVQEGVIPTKTRILAIHTGGLQSISGFNQKLARKGKMTINYEDQL